MDKIRIMIADDHALLRAGLRSLLSEQEDMELVAEATDGLEAIEMAKEVVAPIEIHIRHYISPT